MARLQHSSALLAPNLNVEFTSAAAAHGLPPGSDELIPPVRGLVGHLTDAPNLSPQFLHPSRLMRFRG